MYLYIRNNMKEINDKYIIIVAIIAIVGIVAIVLGMYGINKNALLGSGSNGEDEQVNLVGGAGSICTDSDGGKNPYVYGIAASSRNGNGVDACLSDGSGGVLEHYCGPGFKFYRKEYPCPLGCSNNACIPIKVTYPNGGEKFEQGKLYTIKWSIFGLPSTTLSKVELINKANSEVILLKDSIQGNGELSYDFTVSVKIPDGTYIVSVTATASSISVNDVSDASFDVITIACTDSDGGLDFNVKGTTSGYDSLFTEFSTETDYCADSKLLIEYYCITEGEFKNVLQFDPYECEGGCEGGTCIPGFQDYPGFLIKNNTLDATLVVGDRASADDVIAVTDIINSLIYYYGEGIDDTLIEGNTKIYTINGKDYEVTLNFVDADEAQFVINGELTSKLMVGDTYILTDGRPIKVTYILYQDYAGGIHSVTFSINKLSIGPAKLASEVTDPQAQNLILVGRPTIYGGIEANPLIDAFELPELSPKQYLLKIAKNGDYYAIIVTGIDADGPRKASNYLVNWQDYSYLLNGTELIFGGIITYEVAEAYLNLGGYTYKVQSDSNSNISYDNFDINVDINADGSISNFEVEIALTELDSIKKDYYFYLKDYGMLQYKGADKITSDMPVIKFKEIVNGNIIEQIYSNSTPLATINLDGQIYDIISDSDVSVNDFSIKIDMDHSGVIGDYVGDQVINIIGNEEEVASSNYVFLLNYGLVQYNGADSKYEANPSMRFTDLETGNSIEVAYSIITYNLI